MIDTWPEVMSQILFARNGGNQGRRFSMHKRAIGSHFGVYNFVRKHETLETKPAVAAGLEKKQWSLEQVVENDLRISITKFC